MTNMADLFLSKDCNPGNRDWWEINSLALFAPQPWTGFQVSAGTLAHLYHLYANVCCLCGGIGGGCSKEQVILGD